MENTPNLNLPFIIGSQAQKHITHNEALQQLDAVVQLTVESIGADTPPSEPSEGARYIIGEDPTNEWVGKSGSIAAYQGGAWAFYDAADGWLAVNKADRQIHLHADGEWRNAIGSGNHAFEMLGVQAFADPQNRLAVSSANTLFTHEGNGHLLKINKATTSDTASILFQTTFEGKAEIGLTGDDGLHFKVNTASNGWEDALVIDEADGAVSLPRNPAFLATTLGTESTYDIAGQPVSFENVSYDRTSAYDTSVSTFTAPVEGVYHAIMNLRTEPLTSNARVGFAVNGVIDTHNTAAASGAEAVSHNQLLLLNQGDNVRVELAAGSGLLEVSADGNSFAMAKIA